MKLNKSYDKYEKCFNEFSNNYYIHEDGVAKDYMMLKINHTKKVVEAIERIAKSLNLSDDEIEIAKLLGLLHDVGRFPQIAKYKSDNDRLTDNHARMGVDELKLQNILKDENDDMKNLIYKCIMNHNILDIPADEKDEEIILFSKLIRDADKVDIYRVIFTDIKDLTEDKLHELYSDFSFDIKTSEEIYNAIKNNERPKRADAKTFIDSLVIQISWVLNDMNFAESKRIIKENDYIEKFYSISKWDDKANEIFDMVRKELEVQYD